MAEAQVPAPANASARPNTTAASIVDKRLEDGNKTLAAHYRMHAFECDDSFMKPRSDFTAAKGEEELILKVASPRGQILGYNVNSTMSQSYIDTNHSPDDFDYFDRGEDSNQYRCGAKAANELDAFIARRPVDCSPVIHLGG